MCTTPTARNRADCTAGVEEWLAKFFRKMKTKVNLIPPNLCEQMTRGPGVDKSVDESWD
jgi:hypothetical protein